ncbi:unnamed protein product [Rhizopus stolonifer]
MTTEEKDKVAKEEVNGPKEETQGAYNPDTGEFNWDCPCLGGMANGPCGEDFKASFSCFVLSEAEPKGYDCVEKFQAMQDCFRRHPEEYADEIDDSEDEVVTSSPNEESSGWLSWLF